MVDTGGDGPECATENIRKPVSNVPARTPRGLQLMPFINRAVYGKDEDGDEQDATGAPLAGKAQGEVKQCTADGKC